MNCQASTWFGLFVLGMVAAGIVCLFLLACLRDAEAENQVLSRALRFYAEPLHWKRGTPDDVGYCEPPWACDNGATARHALGES